MDKKAFFIADTHFGHENIIRYEKRPFKSVYEMDKVMIENWNKTVKAQDEVFMLGDFSFYPKEKTTEICRVLNGKKSLIKGNHDRNSDKFYRDCGFDFVSGYPIIFERFWILSHEPIYINSNMPYANIFGHVHASRQYTDHSAQSYCVSAERTAYTPVGFDEIQSKVTGESNG